MIPEVFLAKKLKCVCGGDLFEIRTQTEYPKNYNDVINTAKQELVAGKCPPINEFSFDISDYDVILIGYPNWWSTCPMPIISFLTQNNISGKVILPFCTHGGSGCGTSSEDIKKACPTAFVGNAFNANSITDAKITKWLEESGVLQNEG